MDTDEHRWKASTVPSRARKGDVNQVDVNSQSSMVNGRRECFAVARAVDEECHCSKNEKQKQKCCVAEPARESFPACVAGEGGCSDPTKKEAGGEGGFSA